MQSSRSLLLSLTLAFVAVSASAQQVSAAPAVQSGQPAQPQAFAPNAADKQSIADAIQSAQKSGRRVLVVYQGSWCDHCSQLQQALDNAPDAAPLARDGFVTVRLNVNDLDGLQQFAIKLDTDLKLAKDNGPLLTILDKNGSLLDSRLVTRLLDQNTVSSAKVAKFLTRWSLQAPADEVYKKGLAQLRGTGKLGFVEFGADWCVWCHHMDEFFDQSAAAPIMHNFYIRIPVDYERNEGAPELAKLLGAPAGDGLPLWAVVDADGKSLANSNSPKGNIGFPGDPKEIEEFVAVLQATAKGITPAQVQTIEQALRPQKPQ